jgi:hypothetical protein
MWDVAKVCIECSSTLRFTVKRGGVLVGVRRVGGLWLRWWVGRKREGEGDGGRKREEEGQDSNIMFCVVLMIFGKKPPSSADYLLG